MAERILVVEDDQKIREWVLWHLKDKGFTAAGLDGGVDALKILRSANPPDLLVLDLHMPGMSGIEVLRHLRATAPGNEMPVIIVTGVYKGVEHATKARDVFHIDAYIEKPFKIEALIERINKVLSRKNKTAPQQPAATPPQPPKTEPLQQTPVAAPSSQPPQQTVQPVPVQPEQPSQPEPPKAEPPQPPPVSAAPPQPTQQPVQPEPPKTEQAQPAPAKEMAQGTLSEISFDSLLLQLWAESSTGILTLTAADAHGDNIVRRFEFIGGKPLLARSDAGGEDFGSHLVSQGIASLEEYREYQQLRESGRRDPEEIFISMGCLTPDRFIVERIRHLEELLIECFTLDEGSYSFDGDDLAVGSVIGADVPRVIHEGYRRHMSENRLGMIFSEMAGKYFCRTPQYYDYLYSLELDEDEIKFVNEITGCHMLKDHAESGDFYKVLKAAAALLALGMVEAKDSVLKEQIEPSFPIRKDVSLNAALPEDARFDRGVPEVSQEQEPEEAAGAFEDLGDMLSDELGDIAGELGDLELEIPEQDDHIDEERKQLEEELRAELKRLRGINYYEFFDTRPAKFRMDAVKKLYFDKRKKFSPENFIEWASGDVISMAENVLTQLNTAYNTLSNVVNKEKYDELLESSMPKVSGDKKEDRFQAKVQFESGKAFVEMGEFSSAEQALLEAIDLNPGAAVYHAWLGWAVYSKDNIVPTNINLARKEIAKALKMDPRCATAFAFKGAMSIDEGDLDAAEVELRRALKFNPRSGFAKRKLRELQSRREDENKGILGRIFS